ncbi:MAG: imidazole glycerol phosphate synthase subunit HisH [Chitinophagaceae bacterium]|nr:MAG: imidazole glycerol phosphate synthase subunit HisH [Chitinophagaceae bacterium]
MEDKNIGIINYGGGNISSLRSALDRAGISHDLTDTVSPGDGFERYIIPGVGHAGKCMEDLRATGMIEPLVDTKKPVLGICVGMQLLTSHSEEGNSAMMDKMPLKTIKFDPDPLFKVPHMGWNNVYHEKDQLFNGIENGAHFYFVHSFFVEPIHDLTIGVATHGKTFSAAIRADNFYGVQFHPERSGAAGERLLINFSKI